MLRRSAFCVVLALAACTSTPEDGPSQMQLQAQMNVQQLGIRGADIGVLNTSELAQVNTLSRKNIPYGQKRARVSFLLEKAGAL